MKTRQGRSWQLFFLSPALAFRWKIARFPLSAGATHVPFEESRARRGGDRAPDA